MRALHDGIVPLQDGRTPLEVAANKYQKPHVGAIRELIALDPTLLNQINEVWVERREQRGV